MSLSKGFVELLGFKSKEHPKKEALLTHHRHTEKKPIRGINRISSNSFHFSELEMVRLTGLEVMRAGLKIRMVLVGVLHNSVRNLFAIK